MEISPLGDFAKTTVFSSSGHLIQILPVFIIDPVSDNFEDTYTIFMGNIKISLDLLK